VAAEVGEVRNKNGQRKQAILLDRSYFAGELSLLYPDVKHRENQLTFFSGLPQPHLPGF
jgi:hypothetical protein